MRGLFGLWSLKVNMKHYLYFCLILSMFLNVGFGSSNAQAAEFNYSNVTIETAQPTWQFMLDNISNPKPQLMIEPGERGFVRKIQPMLNAQAYQAVAAELGKRPLEKDSIALQLLRGQVFISLKNYDSAERVLKAVLIRNPDIASAHKSLSLIYMVRKQYQLARTHLSRAIELGAADAQVLGQLAFVNLQLKNAWSAISGYQQALYLEPDNKQWEQGLLFALIASQANDQATALLHQLLNTDIENQGLWLQSSQLSLQQNNYEQSLVALELAMRLGDPVAENYRLAAQLHLQVGSVSRAVELLSDSLRTLPRRFNDGIFETIEETLIWLAYNNKWKANDKLLAICQELSTKLTHEQNARLNIFRAKSIISQAARDHHKQEQKKIRLAESLLKKALSVDPLLGEALMTLADLYRETNKVVEAEMLYVRAQVLEPYQERALLSHAQLLIDTRQYPLALEKLRKVLTINPKRHDLNANIRSLEQLIRYES